MLLDSLLEFSDAQALTTKTATTETISSNVCDLTGGNSGRGSFYNLSGATIAEALGVGGNLELVVQVNVAGDFDASATMECSLQVYSTTTITSGTRIVTITLANDPAAGTRIAVSIPDYKLATTDRYLGVVYKSITGTVNSITMDAFLSVGHDSQLV